LQKVKLTIFEITAGAINFDFIGGSIGSSEGEAIIYGVQYAIDNQTPLVFFPCGGGQRRFESPIGFTKYDKNYPLVIKEL
jgi:Acetyl-CoA carboxylase beta subunit